MSSGEQELIALFRKKNFWPQLLWVMTMIVSVTVSSLLNSPPLFVASILIPFLGLNESGRWSYKTNLLLCVISAVAGTVFGIFKWFEMMSVFILLFTVGGFMLYYKEKSTRLLPILNNLGNKVSQGKNLQEVISLSLEQIERILPECEVIIAIEDGTGKLFLPETATSPKKMLRRNGSAMWKVFASGRSYVTGSIEISRDHPLWRDACSMMVVPLKARGDKFGVLEIESPLMNDFSQVNLLNLEAIAFVISQLIYPFSSLMDLNGEEININANN
ncbi:MAG: GAF domain-containing protein [Synergistaceae bacterium]|nr:GAF domain-containing protein [Synergistaceae bacterium]